jgi:hypothetical protein
VARCQNEFHTASNPQPSITIRQESCANFSLSPDVTPHFEAHEKHSPLSRIHFASLICYRCTRTRRSGQGLACIITLSATSSRPPHRPPASTVLIAKPEIPKITRPATTKIQLATKRIVAPSLDNRHTSSSCNHDDPTTHISSDKATKSNVGTGTSHAPRTAGCK